MQLFLQILFFPLALVRLVLLLLLTMLVIVFFYIDYLLRGFSFSLQRRSMKTWGAVILSVMGVRIKKTGNSPADNFILMPNHRSYLDILIVAYLTPSSFVAKKEVRSWPLMKIAEKVGKLLFVDRSDVRSLVKTMHSIKEVAKEGIPITIFPEGTTYAGPLTKPFKSGSFKIATDTNTPVIPMAINYKDKKDAWVGSDTFVGHFLRQMGKPITHVTIRYDNPIIEDDAHLLKEKTRQSIEKMLQEMV